VVVDGRVEALQMHSDLRLAAVPARQSAARDEAA
jgi:hypothetical protein